MDGQRFDEVARLIGTGASRRRVLKGVLGGIAGLGGAGLARRAGAQEAQGICAVLGAACLLDEDCCTPGAGQVACEDQTCCLPEGSGCVLEGEDMCCPGFTCTLQGCVPEGGTCADEGEDCSDDNCCGDLVCGDGDICATAAPMCAGEGDPCSLNTFAPGARALTIVLDCCDGLICNDSNVCEALAPEVECEVDDDCVLQAAGDIESVICCGGFCIADIECCIDDEDPNDRCAEGATCFEGICVFACTDDADCEHGACCCGDGACHSACCEDVDYTPPAPTGGVTTLPNTGIARALRGDDDDDDLGSGGLLGLGLAAGAAAFLAGKKIKGSEQA